MAERTPVPNSPEPLDALRARYAAALEHVYDVRVILQGGIRPGEVPANVFDALDGLRLIVSRERMLDRELLLHVSASFPAESRMADEFRLLAVATPKRKILDMWLADLPRRFTELSDDRRPLEFVGWSEKGIPHLMIREEPPPAKEMP